MNINKSWSHTKHKISQIPHDSLSNFQTKSWRGVRENEETNLGFKGTSSFWWNLVELEVKKWREVEERGTAEWENWDEESLPKF